MPAEPDLPTELADAPLNHRWNFWVCGWEAALYIAAALLVGPTTSIPFLFKRIGIDDAWLGLFTLSALMTALASPFGTALAGGRRWKLPYCIRMGVLQRLPFLVVPLGAMFLFDAPRLWLLLLVLAWFLNSLFMGMTQPVYQVVITNGIRESWWGRMMSLRNILGAAMGLGATGFVWWVNRRFDAPHNYVVLGWVGIVLFAASLYVVTLIREVPMRRELPHGWAVLRATWREMAAILREDRRVRWIALGRVLRSCGFLMGTYMTPVFIERCGLSDAQMWWPVLLLAGADVFSHALSGWFVDRLGAKPALVLSAAFVAGASLLIAHATTFVAFVVAFPIAALGGSLLMNGWLTLLLKLAPIERRPAYASVVSLTSDIPGMLVTIAGIVLVGWTGFDHVFYVSFAGCAAAAVVFQVKLPNIRRAPVD